MNINPFEDSNSYDQTGCLFLVVGPSGAGKDTLINSCADHFSDRKDIVFPRRDITRLVQINENHRILSQAEFERIRSLGGYILSWTAHGQYYGINKEIVSVLNSGHHVVVNVSRSVLEQARRLFKNLCILSITVDVGVLRKRLEQRQRETPAEIEERLITSNIFSIEGNDVVTIDNNRDLDAAISSMISAIERYAGSIK